MRQALCTLALLAVAGCSDLGSGSTADDLLVVSNDGDPGLLKLSECRLAELAALAHWSDGRYENVSSRTEWSSSDPAVAEVSNADVPVPGGGGSPFAAGVIIAHAAGTATLRASFLGFSDTFQVEVTPMLEMRIVPDVSVLAPASRQKFRLEALLDPDGVWTQFVQYLQWSIVSANAAADLAPDESGVVQASTGPENVPFLLEAHLPLCGRTVTRELRVSPLLGLTLEYEQPADAPVPLEYSDRIRVLAAFADPQGETQDLSGQVEVNVEELDPESLVVAADENGVIVRGTSEELAARLEISYLPTDLTVFSRQYWFADVALTALRLDREALTLSVREEAQLQALGLFEDGIERAVSRHAGWESSDTAAATVDVGANAGRVLAVGNVDQDVIIEAFAAVEDGTLSSEAQLQVRRLP